MFSTYILGGLIIFWIVALLGVGFSDDIIEWLIRRAKRTPYYHLDGYMNRWWLVPYAETGTWGSEGCGPVSWRRPIAWLLQRFGIAVRVHEILRSDLGRHPHDHPWAYVTIILKGFYWEERFTPSGVWQSSMLHGPLSILYRPAKSWHRLDLHQGTVTTLFITGRKTQSWGFNRGGKKVGHRDYLGKQ